MNTNRTLASVGTVAALAAGTIAVTAAPARAAGYNGACGSGYTVIDKMDAGNSRGTIYLTYNNGWNCVVTITNTPGTKQFISAMVERSGGDWVEDEGNYTKFAGPVYVYAPSSCIDWGGIVGDKYIRMIEWNDHCG
ncbi:spore-associated protein A [Micromonospora sp. NPDC050200]|uniref:spore-associated protein A n=1 Tax=Micromonospora sp. NPDC050200 TaxID=3155664 RepID=UPI0033EE6BDE